MLPPIGNSDWIAEAGHNWFTCGNESDGWYFSDAQSPAALRMLLAVERYRKLVAPGITAQYALIGRILPDPRLLVINGRGVFGLQLALVAAMVGDAMFVDVTRQTPDGRSLFTGEEALLSAAGAMPPDSASPKEVIEAMVAAIKAADQELWKLLFAHWGVTYLDDGRTILHPREDRVQDSYWEESRRNLLGKVYAVHVIWTGEPRAISSGKEFPGAACDRRSGGRGGAHRPFRQQIPALYRPQRKPPLAIAPHERWSLADQLRPELVRGKSMPYDRRTQELKDRATTLIGKVSFEETLKIQNALTTYAGIRGTELNNIVLAGKDPTDNPITSYWGPKIEEVRKKLDDVLKSMFDNVTTKSQLALNFQAQARFEDDHFFSALQATKLNVAHDGLIEKDKFLHDYINILSTKWSTMSDQDSNVEKQEEQLALDLNRSVGQSVQGRVSSVRSRRPDRLARRAEHHRLLQGHHQDCQKGVAGRLFQEARRRLDRSHCRRGNDCAVSHHHLRSRKVGAERAAAKA